MSFSLLLRDELKGFYKSKVMIALWVGLPALSIILFMVNASAESLSLPSLTAMLVGSLGGVLAAVMLVVSIVSERERHVYDLFVIRPIRRRNIVLSKFSAVYLCVATAALLAFGVAIAVDALANGGGPEDLGSAAVDFLVVSLSMMAIACSAGVLIGVFAPSILVGVILVMYGVNQLSAVAILPLLTTSSNDLFPLLPGAAITSVLLFLAVWVFNGKQL